jgi:cytochrome c oxidase subunit 3
MATDTFPIVDKHAGSGGLPPIRFDGGGGGGDDHSFRGRSQRVAMRTYIMGVWLAMGGISMVFIAFASALIVRRGVSLDWHPTVFPRMIWLNTAMLVLSSLTIDSARRALRDGRESGFRTMWLVSTALGLGFVAGQIVVWRQLIAQGIYLSTNPSSSFLYLLTGAHGVHLLGGVLAILVVALRRKTSRIAVESISLYWHFMDGLWLFLLGVLVFWS